MKLAWLSPFSTNSAIGRFSLAVTNELSKHVEVDLWVSSREDLLPTSLNICEYNPELPLDQWWPRDAYDFAICNFGDHLEFHRRIFEFSRKVPGVAILHDYVMHHFFTGYYHLVLQNFDAHLRRIEALYGSRGRQANELALSGKAGWIWDTDQVVEFPMFEDCISGSLAVVTHSRFLREKVEKIFPGPVQDIALAYPVDRSLPVVPRNELPIPPGKLLLLTVGNLNRNKRVDEVIECLAANRELAKKVYYVACGSVDRDTAIRLRDLISRSGLDDVVRLNGHTAEAELNSYFAAADVCINLRNPAMEGGSASLAELMLHGKAGIVSDTGVYAEIPDECVLKVRPEHEREDLARVLASVVADRTLRERLGACALRYAEENFTAEVYCRRLLRFLEEAGAWKPVLEPLHRAARTLSDLKIPPDMEIVRTIARVSAEMFCGSADEAPWNRK